MIDAADLTDEDLRAEQDWLRERLSQFPRDSNAVAKATPEQMTEYMQLRQRRSELATESLARMERRQAEAERSAAAAALERSKAQVLAVREREALDARMKELQKAEAESASFWFRRFFTTLGIANAGAFAAMASGVIQADSPGKIAPLVAPAMIHFTWGLLSAGAIPLLLWLRYTMRDFRSSRYERTRLQSMAIPVIEDAAETGVYIAAGFSIWGFAQGLFTALGSLQSIPKV